MFRCQSNPLLFNDAEMLQTDVMRFFSILCLCLMAIFALVKTLPMAPPEAGPVIAVPADRKAEVKKLQEKIAAFKKKLEAMQSQVKSAAAAIEQTSVRAVKATQTEEAARARVAGLKTELEKFSRTLVDIRQAIRTRELKLAQILEDIEDKRQMRAALKDQIENETKSLAKIRQKTQRAEEKLARKPFLSRQSTRKAAESQAMTSSARQGFSLRFASDEVLNQLISDGKVSLYAIAGNSGWRLRLSGERPIYIAARSPRQIYEMETLTVPSGYVEVFQRQIAAYGRRNVIWGVTLPGPTAESIRQLIRNREGGELIITADGGVTLN
jgi:Skp family chaperone for outer membrane proteins